MIELTTVEHSVVLGNDAEVSVLAQEPSTLVIGTIPGEPMAPKIPTFIQDTAPNHPGPYLWWDTSGGNLTLWIEDGQ